MIKKALWAATLLAVATCGAASAATITNGSFENPTVTTGRKFDTLTSGVTGWTIGGSVDLIGTYWGAADGSNSLDLNGNSQGGISQMITDLVENVTYVVSFAIGGNAVGGSAIKHMGVDVGGAVSNYTFDTTGTSNRIGDAIHRADQTKMPWTWVYESFVFTATSASMKLTFASLDDGAHGVALDDVSISALPGTTIATVATVPVPAGGVLLLSGLGMFAALRRRNKNV